MTGVARGGVIELERPKVGFGSGRWMMNSLVQGFRQPLSLIATVSTNALNPDKVSPFCWLQMDWEQPYPAGLRGSQWKIRQRYDGCDQSFLKVGAL